MTIILSYFQVTSISMDEKDSMFAADYGKNHLLIQKPWAHTEVADLQICTHLKLKLIYISLSIIKIYGAVTKPCRYKGELQSTNSIAKQIGLATRRDIILFAICFQMSMICLCRNALWSISLGSKKHIQVTNLLF